MRKNKGHLVVYQHTGVVESRDNEDAYTKYREREGKESVQANPDLLEDSNTNRLWGEGTKPELAELLIERFMDGEGNFPILSKRQNQVLKLHTQGMAVGLIAKTLHIDQREVTKHLNRVGKKFKKLLIALDF
jgi:DNA-binding NarL/FixJ family response regulator